MVETAAVIWADGPTSAPLEPSKAEIRAWGTWVEGLLGSFAANGGLIYTSRALLFADLAHDANSSAWVLGDATAAYNGIYAKSGASGVGAWTRVGDLPYSFIVAVDSGAGTPNAIQATSPVPVSASSLVWVTLAATTTASPATISFNGDAPLTIKTNSGSDPAVGGLLSGMTILGIKTGATFRLVSDQASAAIAAAAAASATLAASYATLAKNDYICQKFSGDGATTDFTLTADPGTVNNIFINVDGVDQLIDSFSLVYVSTVPTVRFLEAPPSPFDTTDTPNINIRYGFRVAVNVPANASVGTNQVINNSILTSQLQESGSLFFTAARAIASVLTGLPAVTNAAIAATDTILAAMAKLQGQINNLITSKVSAASPTITGTAAISNVNVATNTILGAVYNGAFISGHDSFQVCFAIGSGGGVIEHLGATGGGVPVALDMINGSGTRSGYIAIGASTTSYTTSSDYRLKEIESDYHESGAIIDAIKIYDYVWKETGLRGVGALAHELQAAFPDAAHGTKDEVDEEGNPVYQAVDYSKLVPVLIAEIQSLRGRVSALEVQA